MKRALFLCAIFVFIQLFLGTIASAFTMIIIGDTDVDTIMSNPTYLNMLGGLLIICNIIMFALVGYMFTNNCLGAFKDRIHKATGKVWLWGIITLILLMFTINGITDICNVPDILMAQMGEMMENPLCIIAITLIGPIGEEIVFRRGVLEALQETPRFAPWAIVISSLLFGIIHFNPVQIIGAFLLGLFFAWIYVASNKNLLLPIVFHVINNTTSTVMSYALGKDFTLKGMFSNNTIFIIFIIILAFLSILSFMKLRSIMNAQK